MNYGINRKINDKKYELLCWINKVIMKSLQLIEFEAKNDISNNKRKNKPRFTY